MSQHTPGPWTYEAAPYHAFFRVWTRDVHFQARKERRGIADVFNEEDARLIAAAPELLDACKRIVRDYENEDITIGAIEDCQSAIRKAEGDA